MAFCADCGVALMQESRFCTTCGKGASAEHATTATSGQATAGAIAAASGGLAPNMAAALAYLLGIITGVLFLVLEPYKKDPFVRFHALQSVIFSLAWIAITIVWNIAWGIFAGISGSMLLISVPLRMLVSLLLFGLWLFCMYQAYNQREFRIPLIGQIAASQARA